MSCCQSCFNDKPYKKHTLFLLSLETCVNLLQIRDYFFFFRFGLAGNQPFSTRRACSKISIIDQKHEKATTPAKVDKKRWSSKTDTPVSASPAAKNAHQHPVPK